MSPAVDDYHELLGRGSLAADSWAELSAALDRHDLTFGGRPLCNILRPRFLSPERHRLLAARSGVLASALRRMQDVAAADPDVRRRFRLHDWEEELFGIPAGYAHPCPVSRADAFITADGRLRFTEVNAQSPAGAGFSDALSDAFLRLPVVREFARTHTLTPLPTRSHVLAALLAAFRDWAGGRDVVPRLAIVDWDEVPTRPDFVLLQEAFAGAGYPARILSPIELEFDDHTLSAGGEPITLVYRRVLMGELVKACGLKHALIEASRAGAVCVVNPISCRLPGKKASFAFLSDEENDGWLTPEQRGVLRETVPWTRIVEERRTHSGGREVDLIPFIQQHKDRLVLKPNDAYGGRAVVLGWTVDQAAWETAVGTALREPYVVQERVDLPTEVFPSWEGGRVVFAPRWLDTCPFLGPDDAAFGCLTRLSTLPLVNVTAGGGGMVPTFLLTDAAT